MKYLLKAKRGDRALDPVAHFHLTNGARLERLNWLGDVSDKGLAQAAGMMVNYKYAPDEIIANHDWTIGVFGKQYGVIEWGYGSNRSLFGSESTTELFIADRAVFSIGIPLGWIAGAMAALVALSCSTSAGQDGVRLLRADRHAWGDVLVQLEHLCPVQHGVTTRGRFGRGGRVPRADAR